METGLNTSTKTVATSVLEPVSTALDSVLERDLTWRSPTELTSFLIDAPKLQSRFDAMMALSLIQGERAGVHKLQKHDYRTVDQMVADKTGANPEQIRRMKRLGKWIELHPDLAQAWLDGRLLTEQVDLIRRVAGKAQWSMKLYNDQTDFITWANDYDFVDFQRIVKYWAICCDTNGKEPKDQIAKNYVRANKDADGVVKISGRLDPLSGQAFMTAFEAEKQKLFRAAKETASDASETTTDAEPESDGQRGANALINLVAKGSLRDDGTRPEPLITAVVSTTVAEDTIERLGQDFPSTEPLPLSFDDIDKRCELIDGTPIHPHLALQLFPTATFRRQIMTATGRTIDVSLNARCFTKWQKQALAVQTRGRCTTPGCDAPFAWLQADHYHPHSKNGPTRLDNGDMQCGPDNRFKRDTIPDKPRDPELFEKPAA